MAIIAPRYKVARTAQVATMCNLLMQILDIISNIDIEKQNSKDSKRVPTLRFAMNSKDSKFHDTCRILLRILYGL